MRRCRTSEHENPRELCVLLPLLGERAGLRASVSLNLIFGVGGGIVFRTEIRLLTSAATILELTLLPKVPKEMAAFPV